MSVIPALLWQDGRYREMSQKLTVNMVCAVKNKNNMPQTTWKARTKTQGYPLTSIIHVWTRAWTHRANP